MWKPLWTRQRLIRSTNYDVLQLHSFYCGQVNKDHKIVNNDLTCRLQLKCGNTPVFALFAIDGYEIFFLVYAKKSIFKMFGMPENFCFV